MGTEPSGGAVTDVRKHKDTENELRIGKKEIPGLTRTYQFTGQTWNFLSPNSQFAIATRY
jgi:hypothetical protein